jgi:hypothetical protein
MEHSHGAQTREPGRKRPSAGPDKPPNVGRFECDNKTEGTDGHRGQGPELNRSEHNRKHGHRDLQVGADPDRLTLGKHRERSEDQHRPKRTDGGSQESKGDRERGRQNGQATRVDRNRLHATNERGFHLLGFDRGRILSKASQNSCLSPKRGIRSRRRRPHPREESSCIIGRPSSWAFLHRWHPWPHSLALFEAGSKPPEVLVFPHPATSL